MEHKLNIYADCQSEKPTKSYVCRRILFKTATELGELQAKSKDAKDEEQTNILLAMIKCVFPNFEDEDLNGIDPIEVGEFFKAIGSEVNKGVEQAQKNL